MSADLSEEQLRAIYTWIDAIPLSRPKKNMARDFSDGILLAEVIATYFPTMVDLHNYPPANSTKQKVYNFETLNQKVLKKLSYSIPRPTIEDIVNCKPGTIESVLNSIQFKMAKYRERKAAQSQSAQNSPPHISNGNSNHHHTSEKPHDHHHQYINENISMKKNTSPKHVMASVDEEILLEKEKQIRDLQETVEVLELKIAKLEQLVRLKDNKIQKLMINRENS